MITGTSRIEFGDFQTPLGLALDIAALLRNEGEAPDTIVEPTCGLGSFLVSGMNTFPQAESIHGFDINPAYIRELRNAIFDQSKRTAHLECRDFFEIDWQAFFAALRGRILVMGNPPWVTNSALGVLGSANLPQKSNFQGRNGFDAKTGKANFDISEWMLIRLVEGLHRRSGCVAMLCKTATARKTLRHAWINKLNVGRCSLHLIDAKKHFGASVDACLLIVHTGIVHCPTAAAVYADLSPNERISTLGFVGGELVANVDEYTALRDIDGIAYYTWRSGIKHDAAAIMEFTRHNGQYVNGKREQYKLEPDYLFPLLKSSDVANARLKPERYVLLTQRKPSDDTSKIEKAAPLTWAYLNEHAAALDQRRSVIYAKRPKFSVFGVGDYTFSPWKVAISGLYKNCRFVDVGTHLGKPVVLDDTCYLIPCASKVEADFICELLNSDVCQRFMRSLIFFDAKRPVTIDILNRIDLKRVAERLGRSSEARPFLSKAAEFENGQSLLVFDNRVEYRVKRSKAPRASRRNRNSL